MRINDVRILWAKSGNRCAYPHCKTEMAPDCSQTTLGEIAHIVAKSKDGPRGNNHLPLELRDEYDNLVLLCPTHHKLIDDNENDWPVDRIKKIKVDHEQWVAGQLETGSISIRELQKPESLTRLIERSLGSLGDVTWIYSALTPLSIAEDAINPQSASIVNELNKTNLPDVHCSNFVVNQYHTRPSEYGLINEDFREFDDGKAHRIEIYRNGHIEMSICIEGMCQYLLSLAKERNRNNDELKKPIHYTHIRNCLGAEINFLMRTWKGGLPFYNMVYTSVLSNTLNSHFIFDDRKYFMRGISYPVRSNSIIYTQVIERETDEMELFHLSLQRFVESFGWSLPTLNDKDGNPCCPQALM